MDLTRSTMAAYHDGGERNGQFYDSDFGGPLYADGDEGLELPELSRASHREAKVKAKAKAILRRTPWVGRETAGTDAVGIGPCRWSDPEGKSLVAYVGGLAVSPHATTPFSPSRSARSRGERLRPAAVHEP